MSPGDSFGQPEGQGLPRARGVEAKGRTMSPCIGPATLRLSTARKISRWSAALIWLALIAWPERDAAPAGGLAESVGVEPTEGDLSRCR